jgi:hypothetical protein
MTSEGDEAMTDNGTGVAEAYGEEIQREVQRSEAGRVVLRGVQVIVLDDLDLDTRRAMLEILEDRANDVFIESHAVREAWLPIAARGGSYGESIIAAAGNEPGKYRSVKRAAWFEQAPRHVEPPLP